jgi:transcriptional regulator with XRE-family HTH domain
MSAVGPDAIRERQWLYSRRLRERRHALKLTQCEVADRLSRRGSRITNRTLSAMENGRGLDLGLLPDLAQALECTVTYLIGLTTNPQSWQPDCEASPRSAARTDGPLHQIMRQPRLRLEYVGAPSAIYHS